MNPDQILSLAVKLDSMPIPSKVQLPPRPNRQRNIKVERTVDGSWAAWNVGIDSGLVRWDALEVAESIAAAYAA